MPIDKVRRHLSLALASLPLLGGHPSAQTDTERPAYPASRRVDVVDVYHGVEVADPYRWLEDRDGVEVRTWARRQDALTDGALEALGGRDALRARLAEVARFPNLGAPVHRGGRELFQRRGLEQKTGALYVREGGNVRALVDPNPLSEDGSTFLAGWSVDPTGTRVAYALRDVTPWLTLRVRDVATGADLADALTGVRSAAAAWTADGAAFFYVRYDDPPADDPDAKGSNPRVMRHVVGTDQREDALVFAPADTTDWVFPLVQTSPDGRFLTFEGANGARPENGFWILDLASDGGEVVERLPQGLASFRYEANVGDTLYLRTTLDAPRGRLVALPAAGEGLAGLRDVLPEREETLAWLSRYRDRLVACYLDAARRRLHVFDLEGRHQRELPLPDVTGNPGGLSDRLDSNVAFMTYSSIVEPTAVYRLDLETGAQERVERPDEVAWNPADFTSRQVFFESHDGTRVPMFVTHRKDLELDGSNHVLMYGYGAWKWAAFPWFNALRIVWLQSGGVFALPGLRGGGEYGQAWHDAGRRASKPNTFADFVAAAEWLIAEGYTRPDRLAIQGGSASGMLPGVVMNQRPELFGAALVNWPRVDMLRFPVFEGSVLTPEFGDPQDPEEFAVLRSYSPLHNLRYGTDYPAVFVTAGTRDRTTTPSHAYKYVAALQTAQAGTAPVLLRVGWGGGHYPSTTDGSLDVWADQLTFLFHALGVEHGAAAVEAGHRGR